MAETQEAKVKRFIDKWMTTWFPQAMRECPQAGIFGGSGKPDRYWVIPTAIKHFVIYVAIEAKAEGNSPTTKQWYELSRIVKAGGIAAVVEGMDIKKMELIRERIMERLRLAEKIAADEALCSSGGDGQVPAQQ